MGFARAHRTLLIKSIHRLIAKNWRNFQRSLRVGARGVDGVPRLYMELPERSRDIRIMLSLSVERRARQQAAEQIAMPLDEPRVTMDIASHRVAR